MPPSKEDNAFLSVVEQHKGIIYKIANSYCKNTEDRKDLIQEIVYQLWRSFGKYNDQYKYSTWLYKIALNVAISFYRKDRKRIGSTSGLTADIIIATEEKEDTGPQLQLLQRFISELPELDRAIMILYLEEKSYREIAEILGLTETNIATKINRIKNKLKRKFSTIHN
ncbi:sigma-70 family RNA polymerase sigma factor [Chitinophaga filiformis]|uniref:RNA polymerase sigma factor n=1 Tax=Chitinophaga filiformis TaxID=104663 RepID=UPI001F1A2CF1|nr:sigma-70 family RNA polymerase sigma factor [Chitinophaga filiformis]MCF6401482.1 sigma-70 family RNA polymerase sigma factor [Chitinophaga filiformis]